MEIAKLRERIERTTSILRASGFKPEAEELDQLFAQLEQSKPNADDAASEIRKRCHIKWFGDLNVQGVGDKEWLNLLDEVKQLTV
jgi:hypothetical protein